MCKFISRNYNISLVINLFRRSLSLVHTQYLVMTTSKIRGQLPNYLSDNSCLNYLNKKIINSVVAIKTEKMIESVTDL